MKIQKRLKKKNVKSKKKQHNKSTKPKAIFKMSKTTYNYLIKKFPVEYVEDLKAKTYRKGTFLYDLQELDPIKGPIINKVLSVVHKKYSVELGSCHNVWRETIEILKREYNINWISPSQANPHIMMD